MAKLRITLALGDYDRTHALADGSIQPEGVELNFISRGTANIFGRMLRHAEFDASEFSLSNYLTCLSRSDERFIGIPVFPYRAFRHSMVWVNRDAGIREPRDLIGKRFGIPEYSVTALLFLRGVLKHEYGVPPEAIRWFRARPERVQLSLPPGVYLDDIGPGQTLEGLLMRGEIDAIANFWPPQTSQDSSARIQPLFSNVREVEEDYLRRTGIFPIMHMIVIRREIYQQNRWVAETLTKAFQAAKECLYKRLRELPALYSLTPWLHLDIEQTEQLFGDMYPYGLKRNLPTLDAATLYSYEQGLSNRKIGFEELFAPESADLLDEG